MSRIDDSRITSALDRIRKRHHLERSKFVVSLPHVDVSEDLSTIAQVKELFHPSGLLVSHGQPVFAYIRDHTTVGGVLRPEHCRKVHFTVCSALKSMKTQGRFQRYRITNKETNRYIIDISAGWGRTEQRETKLYPCQYCLGQINYLGFRYGMPAEEKKIVLMSFDAKEVLQILRSKEANFRLRKAASHLKSALWFSGYPLDWAKASKDYRRQRDYTCEDCGVRLVQYKHLLDVHHINGDKQNNDASNLRCLCKICHARVHPHYLVKEADRLVIEAARLH